MLENLGTGLEAGQIGEAFASKTFAGYFRARCYTVPTIFEAKASPI